MWKRKWTRGMLRFLCLLLLLETGMPMFSVSAEQVWRPAKDEALPSWAAAEIKELGERGIIKGYADGYFRPERSVSRDEFLSLLLRLTGSAEGGESAAASEAALKAALTGAVPFGAYDGKKPAARQETAYFIDRLLQLQAAKPRTFRDGGSLPDWAKAAVAGVGSAGWMQGYEDGTFRGEATLTRAQAAVIIHRIGEWLKNGKLHLLAAQVNDDGGQPLGEATVIVHRKGERSVYQWGKTNTDGLYWQLAAAGQYEINAWKQRQLAGKQVKFGSGTGLIRLQASPAAAIEGKLTGESGAAAVGHMIALTTNPTFFGVAGPDGAFRVYVLPDNKYTVALIEDPAIRSKVRTTRDANTVLGQSPVPDSLRLLDSQEKERQGCDCRFHELKGTLQAPAAGKTLHIGTIRITDTEVPDVNRPAPGGGGYPPPANTPTPTVTPARTPGASPTPTVTPTRTPGASPTPTVTPTRTPGASPTPTVTPTRTPDASPTPTVTPSQTPGASSTPPPTATPDVSPSPTVAPTPDTEPPAAPTGLTAIPGDGRVALSWTANTEHDLAGYYLYMSEDGGETWRPGRDVGLATSYTVSGLTNGSPHLFYLTAYDASGNESGESNWEIVTPNGGSGEEPPAPPADLQVRPFSSSAALNWSGANDPAVAGYKVYTSVDGGATWDAGTDAGTAISYTATALVNGTTYRFAVTAYNAAGRESVRSEAVQATPTAGDVRLPPDPAAVAAPVPLVEASSFHTLVEFLYKGENPVQLGVEEDAIEQERLAVLRGQVVNADNEPLPGVKVTVHGYERLGYTFTRADGMFDLAVNGGGLLVVNYEREGYMPAQRKIHADWGQYANLPVVSLLAYDSKVTEIELDSDEYQVAQGSPVTDAAGTRQGTLIIPPGASGSLVMPDGSQRELSTMNFRATEYTVGENGSSAMPGELPSFVGYTYAVELSADEAVASGATEVRFDRPLYYYVDNFLEFPVGETVPIGYYDRGEANWVSSKNGRIIGIVNVNGGIAAVDVDGDGIADDGQALEAIGLAAEERRRLAELYEPGRSLWRVPIEHFTPWDCNWPYGPPEDAILPPNRRPETEPIEDPCIQSGSVVGCQDQSLGEMIPVAGTNFNLHYQSKRAESYKGKSTLVIPLSEDALPASLKNIIVTVKIAGRTFKRKFAPSPDQTYRFNWDGKDAYGRLLFGSHPYTVIVEYDWELQYMSSPGLFESSFSRLGIAGSLIANRADQTVSTFRRWEGALMSPANPYSEAGIGGWSFDNWHVHGAGSDTMILGNGTMRSLRGNVGGASQLTYRKGPDLSEEALLTDDYRITEIRPESDGSMLIIATRQGSGPVLYRLTKEGEMKLLHYLNVPALQKWDFHSDSGGMVYMIGSSTRAIYRFDPDERPYWKIAGKDGFPGDPSGDFDGKPALQTDLNRVSNIRTGPDGSVYFIDLNTLHKLDPDGLLSVLGSRSSAGADSGPATRDHIGQAYRFQMAPDGSIYVLDQVGLCGSTSCYGTRIRRISPEGVISLIAGNAEGGDIPIADGVAATVAEFRTQNLFLGKDGSVYFTDTVDYKLYRITPEGTVEEPYRETIAQIRQRILDDNAGSGGKVLMRLMNIGPRDELYLDVTHAREGQLVYRIESDYYRIPSEDGMQLFEFDLSGRHVLTRSALTDAVEYRFAYDEDGRLASIADRYGNLTTIERNAEGKPVAILAPGGQRTALALDGDGELAELTNPAGETYRMQYDRGLLTKMTNPLQGVSLYEYNGDGLLVRAIDPQGGVKTLHKTVGASGQTVTFTDPEGRTTIYEQTEEQKKIIRTTTDPNGSRIVTESGPDARETTTLPDGAIVRKTLSPDPRWGWNASFASELTYTSPDGTVTAFAEQRIADMGDDGRLASYTVRHTLNGDVSSLRYEAESRKFTETTAEGVVSETHLNDKDRVIRAAWPDSGLLPVEYIYDEKGRLSRMEQGEKFVQYAYNELNLVESESDAFGNVKRYQYDAAGRIVSVTTPGNRTYGKSYDALGQITGVAMPDGSSYRQSYTKLGRFRSFGPDEAEPWYRSEYDGEGNILQSRLSGGRTVDHVREPDGGRRPIAMNDPDIERSFSYADDTELPAGILGAMPGDPGRSQSIAYAYSGDNVASMTLAGKVNASFEYAYDSFFNLTNLRMTLNGSVSDTAMQYDRDDNPIGYGPFTFDRTGPLRAVGSMNDGVMDIRLDYDPYGNIAEVAYLIGSDETYKEQYEYDLRGFVTLTTISTAQGTETVRYEYDADGQLTGVTRTAPNGDTTTEAYTYDINKNRTTSLANGTMRHSSYGEHGVLQRAGDTDYAFDADGYLTRRGDDAFSYGARGELLEASAASSVYKYTYDGLGRRVAKEDAEGGTTQYLYGNPDALHLLTASVDADGIATVYYYNEMGLLIALDRGGSRYYVITDMVGTPKLVLDGGGETVKELQYDSFGRLLSDSNPDFRLEIGYAGGIEDRDTGLIRFGYRDYDAASGRWTARDAILLDSGQANLYAYVNNNPVMLRDPCGQFCVGGSAYAGVGAGARLCLTEDGFSSCVEAGFGAGGGLDVAPYEDLAKNELGVEATVKATLGIANMTAGYKLAHNYDLDCLTDGALLRAEAGPFRADLLSPKKSAVKSKVEGFKPHFKDIFKKSGFKAEAAIKTKLCRNFRW